MSNAVEIIDQLKKRFSVDTDVDLAVKLLVSRSAVANWRSRDHVPDRYARIASGATDWRVQYTMFGEWSDIEREAMVLAVARLIRDFSDVGSDYSAFLSKAHRAAASVQMYHSNACTDLVNEMSASDTDSAVRACQRLFYNEMQAGKQVPQ